MNDISTYYTSDGKSSPYDSVAAYARKDSNRSGSCTYWVKFVNFGPDASHMVNPWSMNFTANSFDARLNKSKYEFKKVPRDVFEMYLLFLSSQRDVHYRNAERIIQYG